MTAIIHAAVLTAINICIIWIGYHLIVDDDQPEGE